MQGAAQVGTEVRVNGSVATRQGEYFRFEGTAGGVAAQWLDQAVTFNGASLISGRKKYVPPQTEAMLHDVAGNRIQDGRWEMRWDNENRLVDVRTLPAAATAGVPNQRLRYTYDADGRLIERRRFSWVSGAWSLEEATRYLNDGLQCVAEFNASNALLRRQVWGLDLDGSRGGLGGIGGLLWIVSAANGTHYAAPDGSGNVVALFGTSGTETARYEYGPFGELLRMSGAAIAAENPWRFSSKRQDPTTDWVPYEFRVYDPSSGRWLSRDPIGEAGGENLYGFVGNDPVNQVDPDGKDSTTLGGNNAPPAITLNCDLNAGEFEVCYPEPDAFIWMAKCIYEATPVPGLLATADDWMTAFDEDIEPVERWGAGLRAGGSTLLYVLPAVGQCKRFVNAARVGSRAGRSAGHASRIYRRPTPSSVQPARSGGGCCKGAPSPKTPQAMQPSPPECTSYSGAAFGGKLYPEKKLQQLKRYLERRGVELRETTGNPRFDAHRNGTGVMHLPRNPTALQVKHELSHYLDFRNMGFEAYRCLGRPRRELAVLERLQSNRIWQSLNDIERNWSVDYARGLQ